MSVYLVISLNTQAFPALNSLVLDNSEVTQIINRFFFSSIMESSNRMEECSKQLPFNYSTNPFIMVSFSLVRDISKFFFITRIPSFNQYYESIVNDYFSKGSKSNYQSWKASLNHFKKVFGEQLMSSQLNNNHVKKYRAYLLLPIQPKKI